jgi:hypothetical protein
VSELFARFLQKIELMVCRGSKNTVSKECDDQGSYPAGSHQSSEEVDDTVAV